MNECELMHNFTHKEAVFAVDINATLVVTGSADRVRNNKVKSSFYTIN
jgi:hypothetical protein